MTENELAKIIVDAAFQIHQETGPGLLESVYEIILVDELERRGLKVERQKQVPVVYKGRTLDEGFRADLVVNNKLIVELKSVESVRDVHKKTVTDVFEAVWHEVGPVN